MLGIIYLLLAGMLGCIIITAAPVIPIIFPYKSGFSAFPTTLKNQEIIYTIQVSKSVPTPKEAGSMSQIRLIPDTLLPSPVSIFDASQPSIPAKKNIRIK